MSAAAYTRRRSPADGPTSDLAGSGVEPEITQPPRQPTHRPDLIGTRLAAIGSGLPSLGRRTLTGCIPPGVRLADREEVNLPDCRKPGSRPPRRPRTGTWLAYRSPLVYTIPDVTATPISNASLQPPAQRRRPLARPRPTAPSPPGPRPVTAHRPTLAPQRPANRPRPTHRCLGPDPAPRTPKAGRNAPRRN